MGNIYKKRRYISESEVTISLSPALYKIVDMAALEQGIKQLNKMPKEIPPVIKITKATGPSLVNTPQAKIQKVKDLQKKSTDTGIFHVHVAYELDEKYSLRNAVGAVFATNSGLILLNDVRLKQVARNPIDPIYLVNLIIHELLHVYGIDHAAGLGVMLKNGAVMNAGKFGRIGMSHDDKAALLENYLVPKRNKVCLTINATGGNVGLLNRDKKKFSQGKYLRNSKAIFTHLKKGKYSIYINGVKKKNITVNKDKEVTL